MHTTLHLLLDKLVGTDKKERSAVLLYDLKRLRLKDGAVGAAVANMDSLQDYSNMDFEARQRCRRGILKVFDHFLVKMCGSEDMNTQREFLDNRFTAMHLNNEEFEPLITSHHGNRLSRC